MGTIVPISAFSNPVFMTDRSAWA
ncbi:MAG: hypothetical protein K0R40_1509, partial [Burkholderiales bacterium]|nr:hypothetical protein [Burkholderiales bacterium]